MKKDNQKIKCDVYDCAHCNCECDCCSLNEIKVCSCSQDKSKKSTMCDSYEKKN